MYKYRVVTVALVSMFALSSRYPVSQIQTKVAGEVAGVFIPYSLPNPDGCKNCNLQCPLQTGSHTYINVLPVLKIYPDVSTGITPKR